MKPDSRLLYWGFSGEDCPVCSSIDTYEVEILSDLGLEGFPYGEHLILCNACGCISNTATSATLTKSEFDTLVPKYG